MWFTITLRKQSLTPMPSTLQPHERRFNCTEKVGYLNDVAVKGIFVCYSFFDYLVRCFVKPFRTDNEKDTLLDALLMVKKEFQIDLLCCSQRTRARVSVGLYRLAPKLICGPHRLTIYQTGSNHVQHRCHKPY